MAKTRARSKSRMKGRPKGVSRERRSHVIQFRASETWKEWMTRYAKSRQLTAADMINQALITMAKADGFEPPPNR